MKMADAIKVCEEQTGKKIPAVVVNIAKQIDRMGVKYECIGRDDAEKNLQALSFCRFQTIVSRELADDPQMALFIAEYMHDCYIRGYKSFRKDLTT